MNMNDDISRPLADYMAPITDDGFSDAVMMTIAAKDHVALSVDLETTRWSRWAGPIISLCLGGAAALIWNAIIGPITLPAAPDLDNAVAALNMSWLYLGFAATAVLAWLSSEALATL